MGVNVSVDLSGMRKKLSHQSMLNGRRAFMNDAHQAMEQFVPKQAGNLRNQSTMSVDGSHIDYVMPYAKAQFYGVVNGASVHNYSTPGTSKRWDLRLKARNDLMQKCQEAFISGAGWK